ncbi:MAG: hypothetical protein ACJ74Q_06205 [Pyrinomonadaceae bacterium]
MLTTREAKDALQARGIEVSYSNLALWVRSGKFTGAELEETPRGPVWMIPAASVEKFVPPRRGRRPTNQPRKSRRAMKGSKQ